MPTKQFKEKDGSLIVEPYRATEKDVTPSGDDAISKNQAVASLDTALRQISSQPDQEPTYSEDIIDRMTSEERNWTCTKEDILGPESLEDFPDRLPAGIIDDNLQERLEKLIETLKNFTFYSCRKDDLALSVAINSNPNSSYEDFRDVVIWTNALAGHPKITECGQKYWAVWFANGLISYPDLFQEYEKEKYDAHAGVLEELAESLNGDLHDQCPKMPTSPKEMRKANDIKMIMKQWAEEMEKRERAWTKLVEEIERAWTGRVEEEGQSLTGEVEEGEDGGGYVMPESSAEFKRDILDPISPEYDWKEIDYSNYSTNNPADGIDWPTTDTIHIWRGALCKIAFSLGANYGSNNDNFLTAGENSASMVYIYDGVVRCTNL